MHVRQLPSGLWRVIVQHDGRRRSATAETKAAAKTAGARMLLELGQITAADGATVADMLREHMATIEIAQTTRYSYDGLIAALPETMTATRVDKVTPLVVQRWYADMMRIGWTAHRVQSVHKLVRAAFNNARRWGWTVSNPVADARPPAASNADHTIPSSDQVVKLLKVIDASDAKFACYVRLAAVVGSRRGETAGLQWHDVDFDAGTVTIRRAIANIPKQGLVVTSTKTGSKGHRQVAVSLPTLVALRRLRLANFEAGLAVGVPQTEASWVFTQDFVNPMSASGWTKKFRDAADAVGLKDVRLHDLRHFVATELLAAGIDVRTVAGRLGHANPAMTLSVYAAWMPARDRAASELLEERLAT